MLKNIKKTAKVCNLLKINFITKEASIMVKKMETE